MKKTFKIILVLMLLFLNTNINIQAKEEITTEVTTENISDEIELFKFHHNGGISELGTDGTEPITLKFIGHKFTINAYKADDAGDINITLDGKSLGTVSTFAEDFKLQPEAIYTSELLEEGEHTLVMQQADDSTFFYLTSVTILHNPIKPTEIAVKNDNVRLEETETYELNATVLPKISTQDILYQSADNQIATVSDNGTITALKPGNTTITLTSGELTKAVQVTVDKRENNFTAIMGSTDRHYKQTDYAEVAHSNSTEIVPFAYQNDEINSEIVLLTKNQELTNVQVSFSDFTSETNQTIPGSVAKSFFLKETSAHMGRGGTFGSIPRNFPKENIPDILDTVSTKNVEAHFVQPIWIKLNIPEDTKLGTYSGTVTITADNGLKPITLPYKFNVLPIKQPEQQRFSMELWQYPFTTARYYGIQENELFSEKHLNLLKQELSEYKKAGGDSITTTISENPWNSQTYDKYPSMVKWTKKANGNFEFDYTNFDKYVQLCLDLGISKQIKSFSITPWNNKVGYFDEESQRNVMRSYPTGSIEWKQVWGQFLESYINHLDEKGWFDIAYMAMDERPIYDMQEVINLLETHKNKDNRRLKLSAAMNYSAQNAEILAKVDDISIVLSHINAEDDTIKELAKQRRAENKTTTLYTCVGEYPSSFTRSAPAESAWTLWYAESIGMDGFLRWAYDAWVKDPETSVDHWYWEGGDPFFVYPANHDAKDQSPRTSPRFERLKEAKRNIEKLRFIKQNVPEASEEIEAFLQTLVRKYGVRNSYGAMESPSKEQDDFIGNEVARMNQKVYELSLKYLDVLAEKQTSLEVENGKIEFPNGSFNPYLSITKVDNIDTSALSEADKATLAKVKDSDMYEVIAKNVSTPLTLYLKYDTNKTITNIYHIKADNSLEIFNGYQLVDGLVAINATSFSPYIIAYKVEEPTDKEEVQPTDKEEQPIDKEQQKNEMKEEKPNITPAVTENNIQTTPTNITPATTKNNAKTKAPISTNAHDIAISFGMLCLSFLILMKIRKTKK